MNKRKKFLVYAVLAVIVLVVGWYIGQRQRANRIMSLQQQLTTGEASEAYEALRRLTAMGEGVGGASLGLLKSEQASSRARAAWVIGQSDNMELGAEVAELLNAGQPAEVRASAAEAVGQLGYAPANEQLIAILEESNPDQEVLHSAILALGKIGVPGGEKALGEVLNLPEEEQQPIREAAAMALGGVATPTAVGILQKHLREDEEARVRQLCAESLAQAGAVEADAVKMAEQALIRALVGNGSGSPDDNSGVRIAAAYSLGLLPGTENGEARRQALTTAAEEDPHYWVRAAAEESLD